MTLTDAAKCLMKDEAEILSFLEKQNLFFTKAQNQIYFGHQTAKALFQFSFDPKIMTFQIVKGGTGKTSLVHEFAVRSSLYGAKVLCIDMDQQGNLTHAFNQDAEKVPVMIDVLVDNYPIEESILKVDAGIDLIPSRFENTMLDEVLRIKKLPIEKVYRSLIWPLKSKYDLIVIDCPPSIGQSVAACTLASDCVVAPVTPEKFALLGLDITRQSVAELKEMHHIQIPIWIAINKFDARTALSYEILKHLLNVNFLSNKLLNSTIRLTQEFPKAISRQSSIFDSLKPSGAKDDIDSLTREMLGLGGEDAKPKAHPRINKEVCLI